MHRIAVPVLRTLIGVTMLVVGLLKFIRPEFKVADDATLQSFIDTGWLWQLIGAAEAIGGALLLTGFVPLGLSVLAPVTIGILAFSLKAGGEEASVGPLLAALHAYLVWQHREGLRPLITRTPAKVS